ncbi:MAG: DUF4380 domain-containing protein [Armatimonadetes bacterium]|nr:DUF4380 domain-containing protein [Armatimonadota bacterium]
MRAPVAVALTGLLASMHAHAAPVVSVRREAYQGRSGCFRISNGEVSLVVAPSIGRIVFYGPAAGPNLLWEQASLRGKTVTLAQGRKEWTNFGGDKLWPAPQSKWNWPPDPSLDGIGHTATALKGGSVRLTSAASPVSGIRFERVITMNAADGSVAIRNTMLNTSDQDVEWSVWEVAQVAEPRWCEMPVVVSAGLPKGWTAIGPNVPQPGYLDVRSGTVRLRRNPAKAAKIGGWSPSGLVRARIGAWDLTLRAKIEADGGYPDGGCPQEVFSSPDPLKYMELELLGPVRLLQPGDSQTLTTTWSLRRAVPGR